MRRLATTADFDSVFAIYMHESVIPYLGVDPMGRGEFAAVFEALLATRRFYVVEVDGRVQGFYKALRQEGRAAHVAYLGTIAVDPAAHGSGLARRMLEEAIDILKQEGIIRVQLTLEADNPRAARFYQKLGFEPEGRLRAGYKRAGEDGYVDQILMARLL
jgi:RimJ/RimL family protein N-acetyltransferase